MKSFDRPLTIDAIIVYLKKMSDEQLTDLWNRLNKNDLKKRSFYGVRMPRD